MAGTIGSESLKRLVFATGVLALFGQRIGIPVGGSHVSFSVIAMLLMFGALLLKGWPISAPGLGLWLALVVVGAVSALTHTESSVASFLLMLATYVPLLLLPVRSYRGPGLGCDLFEGVLWATKVGAVLAIVQVLLQWGGRTTLWDPFLHFAPRQLQVTGYNTLYSLKYVEADLGLSYKPNGVVFLEPSFLSMYCALALVWLAYRSLVVRDVAPSSKVVAWTMILVLALVLSMSTTGLLILALGMLGLAMRVVSNLRLWLFIGIAAFIGGIAGLFNGIVAKVAEGTGENTSTGLRLSLPYELLTSRVEEAPFIGHGPGSATDIASALSITGLQVPTVLKAALEYGLLGVLLFALALIVMLTSSRPPVSLTFALIGAWLIPAEALLSVPTVALLFFALPHLGAMAMATNEQKTDPRIASMEDFGHGARS